MRVLSMSVRIFVLILFVTVCRAQDRPFLFTLIPPAAGECNTVIHYDAAYGSATFEPLGGDNLEQRLGVQAGLNDYIMVVANLGLAMDGNTTRSAQHVELLGNIMKSEKGLFDLSFGPGFRHEYSGTDVLLGRAMVGRRFSGWQLYSNFLLEKPLAENRDELDLMVTLGWSYDLSAFVKLGVEAVGEDLEGFWEVEEAEGGARLFVGPVVSLGFPVSPWKIVVGAGPIIHATQSSRNSGALRSLTQGAVNGYMVRAMVNYGL
jgi:hypothetical protein